MHNLLTVSVDRFLDNLWAICGSPVHGGNASRIVVSSIFDMSKTYRADC